MANSVISWVLRQGLGVGLLSLGVLSSARADTTLVAVAANFSGTAQTIASDFKRMSGHTVTLVPGGTGKLYAQIKNGAPYQVLLSADDETPSRLVQEGAALANSQFTYATGRLVLWSPQPGVVDAPGTVLGAAGLRVAMADPKTAPYGAAAMQVMQQRGVWQGLQGRLIQGESIAQTYQFVASGNAPMGFVALSQVMRDGRLADGSAWQVPVHLHQALRQDAVLLNPGQGQAAALAFLAYLRTEPARRVMRAVGYE
ncbi:MAG: molybdate ABC transporter substrate-binding protein [Rhodoferax sp.]|uniref:molybdate ABC transporter substrate-binding protein n=1 Tax=Rhodoferax sp. TaxID=50421 RepID=UPI002ACE3897|nr:molybdate ABC transporter substrate-binding protein [Rhodoferax sp.]MDZ7892635.1 molybdate ABC transporter substrate-binding protein [Rhodoferax sp.]